MHKHWTSWLCSFVSCSNELTMTYAWVFEFWAVCCVCVLQASWAMLRTSAVLSSSGICRITTMISSSTQKFTSTQWRGWGRASSFSSCCFGCFDFYIFLRDESKTKRFWETELFLLVSQLKLSTSKELVLSRWPRSPSFGYEKCLIVFVSLSGWVKNIAQLRFIKEEKNRF